MTKYRPSVGALSSAQRIRRMSSADCGLVASNSTHQRWISSRASLARAADGRVRRHQLPEPPQGRDGTRRLHNRKNPSVAPGAYLDRWLAAHGQLHVIVGRGGESVHAACGDLALACPARTECVQVDARIGYAVAPIGVPGLVSARDLSSGKAHVVEVGARPPT